MYSYNFTVRKTSSSEYTIFSEKGFEMHVLSRCTDPKDAEERARAWASSWSSVCIKVEDEQKQQRD